MVQGIIRAIGIRSRENGDIISDEEKYVDSFDLKTTFPFPALPAKRILDLLIARLFQSCLGRFWVKTKPDLSGVFPCQSRFYENQHL